MSLPLLWLVALPSALACEEPSTTPDLEAALVETDEAFVAADLEAFEAATSAARATVDCLEEVAPARVVAQLHRTEGLAAFFQQDTDRAGQAFAAARKLDPLYRFSAAVVPPGNPLLDVYMAVDLEGGSTEAVPTPAEGSVRIDGRRATRRPTSHPALFQRLGGEGRVVSTRYLWPADALPTFPVAPAEPTPAPSPASVVSPQRSYRTPLRIGAAGAAITSGLLFGAAALVHAQYDNTPDGDASLGRLRGTNNALLASSGVTMGIGAGLLGVSFAVP